MAEQRAITSFFTPKKRKPEPDAATPAKKSVKQNVDSPPTSRPLSSPSSSSGSSAPQPSSSARGRNALASYKHGSSSVVNTLDGTHVDVDYQQRFRHHFLGIKPQPSARREMKPYDLQFIELKRQNPDAILMVQNGYKYQILGEDAFKVARFLGRSPIMGWRSLDPGDAAEDGLYDRFASLTFPLDRLPYYVEKLVMQGLKVSVAKQLETSALKAQGSNKRGPFRREVTNTYTKGTMVEELTSSSPVSGHILALRNRAEDGGIALVACQPATGDAVYDSFGSSDLLMELETRLMHIQPSEILLVGEISGLVRRVVRSLDVRVIEMPQNSQGSQNPQGTPPSGVPPTGAPPNIPDAPDPQCLAALREYLSEFNLASALSLKAQPFSLKSYMYLNGDTLNSLEIYENQTTKEPLGSLFWALDNTVTPFGRRLLRSWIGKPLLDRSLIAMRVEAMEEIMYAEGEKLTMLQQLQTALKRMPDLERYTLQIYHSRIQPKQLYWFLYFFNVICLSITEPQIKAAKINSPVLQRVLQLLQPLRNVVSPLLAKIDSQKVRHTRDQNPDITLFFDQHFFLEHGLAESDAEEESQLNAEFKRLKDTTFEIAQCRHSFEVYLAEESQRLGITLKHVNAMGEEDTFVIGVPKRDAPKIPAAWRRQGAITTEVRFWSPVSIEKTKILKPLLETQTLLAQNVYDLFVQMIASRYFDLMRDVVTALAELDCLASLALVSSRPQYVKPDLVDEPCLEIAAGRHPMLDQLMLSNFVPNSANMYPSKNRVMIVTGANMGGKSSFVRQVALLVIMAQIGCYVPAQSARISIMDAVYTRMGAFDNLMRGESTFMVELKECSSILAKATPRSLVILDEVGRGTSTMDGVAIAHAVLQYMIEDVRCFTLFITHYQWLCQVAQNYSPAVQNWSMDCAERDEEVTFLYQIVPRPASRSYGINVARLAGLPSAVLDAAKAKSVEFERTIESRRAQGSLRRAVAACLAGEKAVQHLRLELEEDLSHSTRDAKLISRGGEIEETQD